MRVNIESMNITIGQDREQVSQTDFHIVDTVEGSIGVKMSGKRYGNGVYVNTTQDLPINSLTKNTQQLITKLIKEIEEELAVK